MPFLVLVILCMMSGIIFVSVAVVYSCESWLKKQLFTSLFCFLFFGSWLTGAQTRSPKILKEQVIRPTTLDSIDSAIIQVIAYTNADGEQILVNLNKQFSGVIPPNCFIKVTEYKKKYYCGVDYSGTKDCCAPTCSIVPDFSKIQDN